jgi:hypothetical protein
VLLASHFCPSARPLHNALYGLAGTHGRAGVIGSWLGGFVGMEIRESRWRITSHTTAAAEIGKAFPDACVLDTTNSRGDFAPCFSTATHTGS